MVLAGCGEQQPSSTSAAPAVARGGSRQQFLEGYRAYTQHNWPAAMSDLRAAADSYPQLGDYSLYYLSRSAFESGDLSTAAASANRLIEMYPQSVMAMRARVLLADIALKQGHADQARDIAARVVESNVEGETERDARLKLAEAFLALGEGRGAYNQIQALRHKYPHGKGDAQARQMLSQVLRGHPELAPSGSSAHREEAELLMKEGQSSEALREIEAALPGAEGSQRAELLWLEAKALHSEPAREREALESYLAVAPDGPLAPEALFQLARGYWHENSTDRAKDYFQRVVNQFPSSRVAPQAMMSIGRIYEEENQPARARDQYQRLAARYPGHDEANEARFRAAWMAYQAGDFRTAADAFSQGRSASSEPVERDRMTYWYARSLEKSGDSAGARAIYSQLAASTETNYYPALANRKLGGGVQASLAAAGAADFSGSPPPAAAGDAAFHLVRVNELSALGLNNLEVGELKALKSEASRDPSMRNYLLGEFQHADDYKDAMALARELSDRGELSKETAERVRYPRAYWTLLSSAAQRESLDPYLVAALTRQESLFDPDARSGSDARGLMQLLPKTADRVAAAKGTSASDLYDPGQNVELGSAYLRQLMTMFGQDPFKAVAAYNAGEHAVERWNKKYGGEDDEWVENIDYRETRDYVKKVLGGVREYQLLYGGSTTSI